MACIPHFRHALGRLAFLALACLAGFANAEAPVDAYRFAGITHVDAVAAARSFGFDSSAAGSSLTIRSDRGVLVLFADSPDVLFRPEGRSASGQGDGERSLAAPVARRNGGWYAPAEALEPLGVRAYEGELRRGSTRVPLAFPVARPPGTGSSDVLELERGVRGLVLYAGGAAGFDTVALTLVDVAALSVALPELRSDLDDVMTKSGRGHALYYVVTSLAASEWEMDVAFTQNGRSFQARYPLDLTVLAGVAGTVSPGEPASGVILLPEWVDVRAAMEVAWQDARSVHTFR